MEYKSNLLKELLKIRRDITFYFLLSAMLGLFSSVNAETWVEDTFEDFADGTLDASGQNIYVSRDGAVRTIQKFDLNEDGWIDLLFMNQHDMSTNNPATLAEISENREVNASNLAVNGSIQVEEADLNRDGFSDLVFTPTPSGIQNPRLFLTIIYGGRDGWSSQRASSALPVNGEGHYYRGNIVMTAIADLNHDRWPDIVTLNSEAWLPGQPAGKIARIYWGSERGFLLSRYQDEGIPKAEGMVAGDFDGDNAADVAFLKSDNTIQILWAHKSEKIRQILNLRACLCPAANMQLFRPPTLITMARLILCWAPTRRLSILFQDTPDVPGGRHMIFGF